MICLSFAKPRSLPHPFAWKALSFYFLLLALALNLSAPAEAGEVRGKVDCKFLSGYCIISNLAIKGSIDDATTVKLRQIFAEFDRSVQKSGHPTSSSHTTIELDSPGGSVSAAMAIGRLLRKNRMTANVIPPAVCNSACVFIYAGAVTRFGHDAEKIGIHQPFLDARPGPVDADLIRNKYAALLQDMRSYLHEMNVSEQLADEMLKTPSSAIRYLTPQEQDQFGLVIFDPVEIEVQSLERAQELGLDRAEYNRRERLILSRCPLDSNYGDCNETVFKTGKLPILPDFSSQGTPVPESLMVPKRRR